MGISFLFAVGFSLYAGIFLYAMVKDRVPPWTKKGAYVLLVASVFLAIAACAAIGGVLSSMGGTAGAGKIVGDHYYLGNHGEYTEVSEQVWWLSYWHGRVYGWVVVAFFVVAISMGILEAGHRSKAKPVDNDAIDAVPDVQEQVRPAAKTNSPPIGLLIAGAVATILVGQLVACMLFPLVGVRLFDVGPLIMGTGVLFTLIAPRCPGGRGLVRCLRGGIALVLGFGGLVGLSLFFFLFYRVFYLLIRDGSMHVSMLIPILGILFMNLFVADRFFGTAIVVLAPKPRDEVDDSSC